MMLAFKSLRIHGNLVQTRLLVTRFYTSKIKLFNTEYEVDEWTNVTKNIQDKLGRNLLQTKYHPLNHLKNKISYYFYKVYQQSGSPIFSIYDNFNPVVTVEQNFDSLLTPKDHVSRSKKDCFYVNKNNLLRAHTTAHSSELIRSGLDAFLTFGDVYRRDEIDSKHYPVFHQCDGARLFIKTNDIFNSLEPREIFSKDPNSERTNSKQLCYTEAATKLVEQDMKDCLTGLASFIFSTSSNLNMRWIETTFPFTHPSWELEIEYKGTWYEVLGCGVLEYEILKNAGADNHIGWAFGLGLERWAMILNDIPDIRIFWSQDSGFLSQFKYDDPKCIKNVKYKAVSVYPQCPNDISFWIPDEFSPNDFYDLVRDIGGDLVEQVELIDKFTNKSNKTSHCYRIIYRSMERTLSQQEVNQLHKQIEKQAAEKLDVKIR